MARTLLTCATAAVLATTLLSACSSSTPVDDSAARLSRPGHGSNEDEGARTLLEEKGTSGLSARIDVPRSAQAVRISVSCAPTGKWRARIGGDEGGSAGGACNPRPGGSVMLEYGIVGRHSLSLTASPGRWWLVVESIDHVQSA